VLVSVEREGEREAEAMCESGTRIQGNKSRS